MAPDAVDRWVLRRHARPGAHLRLLCLPHAGGDTWMFGGWQAALPPSVDVCPVRLPGRGSRMADPPISDLEALVTALAEGVHGLLDRPFAIFGHSMGALIGVALARALKRDYDLVPALFCAAACRAPKQVWFQPPISHLPPDQLLDALRVRFDSRDDLAGDQDLVRLVLPTLRADLALCENFAEVHGEPLHCPVAAYGGSEDATIGVLALEDWSDLTTGPFRCHILNGDHFFPIAGKTDLLSVLAQDLTWAMS